MASQAYRHHFSLALDDGVAAIVPQQNGGVLPGLAESMTTNASRSPLSPERNRLVARQLRGNLASGSQIDMSVGG
ncbi:hypothetical protein [Novipirellula aureliae]|uniref:hypothetical protein n=1 Tax=Novipirellula aureliae TaxID=2527966 RepID=UPI0011B6B958|nr:hypothetical protein [Novipirellula aureliae]